MKKTKRKKEMTKNASKGLTWDVIKFTPLFIFVCLVPLAVKMKVVHMDQVSTVWLPNPFVYVDVFNYYKYRLIQIAGILSAIFFCIEWVLYNTKPVEIKKDWPLLGFVACLIISTILSPYKEVVLGGYAERWHGLSTWLSYVAIYLYGRAILKNEIDRKVVLRMLLFAGFMTMGIGALQFFGLDPFRTDFMKRLIATKEILEQGGLEQIKFTFEKRRVYSTLYNPNNVGLVAAAFIPLSLYGTINENSNVFKVLWAATGIFSVICIFGSESRAGIVAVFVAFMLYAVMNIKDIKQNYKQLIIGGIGAVVLIIGINVAMQGEVARLIKRILPEQDSLVGIQDMDVHKNDLSVLYNGEVVRFEYDLDNPSALCNVVDEDAKPLDVSNSSDGYIKVQGTNYEGFTFGYGKYNESTVYLSIPNKQVTFNFALSGDGFKFINQYGHLVELQDVESIGFDSYQMMGSNRGYIWSRTLAEFIKNPKFMLFGSGPDSYVLRFPQTDYIAKGLYYQDYKQVVDKPHNQYLGMLVEFGVVGLVLILMFIMIHISKLKNIVMVIPLLCVILSLIFYDVSVNTVWVLILMLVYTSSNSHKVSELTSMSLKR